MRSAPRRRTLAAMEHGRLNLLTADPGLFDKLTTASSMRFAPGSSGIVDHPGTMVGLNAYAATKTAR